MERNADIGAGQEDIPGDLWVLKGMKGLEGEDGDERVFQA